MPVTGIQGSQAAAAARVAAARQAGAGTVGQLGGQLGGRTVRVANGGPAYLKPVPQSRIQGQGRGRARGATVLTLSERRVRLADSHLPKLNGPPLPSRPGSVAWTPISAARQESADGGYIYANTKPPADPTYESLEPQYESVGPPTDSTYESVGPPSDSTYESLEPQYESMEPPADSTYESVGPPTDSTYETLEPQYESMGPPSAETIEEVYVRPEDIIDESDESIEEIYVRPEDIVDEPDTAGDADGGYQNPADLRRAAAPRPAQPEQPEQDESPTYENVTPPTEKAS